MNTNKCYLVLPALVLVSAIGTPPAFALGGVNEKSAAVFPSRLLGTNPDSSQVRLLLSCINGATGAFLDCPFTVDIPRDSQPPNTSANNGGHTHDATNNANARPLGGLEYGGAKGVLLVSGSTGNQRAVVTHSMPEFSGKIVTRVDLKVQPPTSNSYWLCRESDSHRCLDSSTSRTLVTMDVRVPKLESLPSAATAPYIKYRSPDENHQDADAFYGLPTAISALTQMASLFKEGVGAPLSINDMSLPKGGKFDVNGSWSGAHGEHRIGLSADINRRIQADGQKMPCLKNRDLRDAVDSVIPATGPRVLVNPNAKGRTLSRLYCEPDGKQHIDFDGIPILGN